MVFFQGSTGLRITVLEEKTQSLGSEYLDPILDPSLTCCVTPGSVLEFPSPENVETAKYQEVYRTYTQPDIERNFVPIPTDVESIRALLFHRKCYLLYVPVKSKSVRSEGLVITLLLLV